jgi:hypothetical protein
MRRPDALATARTSVSIEQLTQGDLARRPALDIRFLILYARTWNIAINVTDEGKCLHDLV